MRRVLPLVLLVAAVACKGEDLIPTAPAAAPPPPEEGPMATTLATATFSGANGYNTVGGAVLEEGEGGQVLRLGDDFATDRSSALDVRLCRRRRCGDDDLILGAIQGFQGAQSYGVPGDGSGYDFVVIWCGAVELPFGHGRLE